MAEPIQPDLPQRLAQYQRKYAGQASDKDNLLYPALRSATPAATSALQRLDLQRIARGQDPYTANQSAFGLTSASQSRQVTPEPEQGFFGDLLSNTSDLVRAIPTLPVALFNEAKALPQTLEQLPDALANTDGGGLLNTLGNVANLPGIRFVPGSFIAGAYGDPYTDPVSGAEITPGGTQQLIDNPLFTALDVLPFASKAAKMSGTYGRVASALEEQARILNNPPPRAPRPIPTVLRNIGGSVDQTADLRASLLSSGRMPERGLGAVTPGMGPVAGPVVTPNSLGRVLDTGSQRFAGTAAGKYLADMRAPLARTAAERGIYGASYLTDPERAAQLDPVAAQIMFDARAELQTLEDAISPDRVPDIYNAMVKGDDQFLANLSPDEKAYVDRYTQGQKDLEDYMVAEGTRAYNAPRGQGFPQSKKKRETFVGLLRVPFAHGEEVFNFADGANILDARHQLGRAQWFRDKVTEFRATKPGSSQLTPQSLQAELGAIFADNKLRAPERSQAVRLSLATARRAGYDVDGWLRAWDKAKDLTAKERFAQRVADPAFTQSLRTTTRAVDSAQVIADTITAIAPLRARPLYTTLHDALKRGDISGARAAVRQLKASRVHVPAFNVQTLSDALRDLDLEQRVVGRGIEKKLGYTDKQLTKYADNLAKLEAKTMPARWDDLVREKAATDLINQIADLQTQGKLTPEQASMAIDAAGQNLYARVESTLKSADPALVRIISDNFKGARESWQQLAQQGLEPRWVHRVTPDQATRMANPVIFDTPNLRPGQVKARLWDPAPAVPDLTISLTHQAYDILNAKASRAFAEEMGNWYGVTGEELWLKYEPRSAKIAAKTGQSVDRVIQDLVVKDYTPYDPGQFLRGKRKKDQTLRVTNSADQMFVPREVASTLESVKPTLPSTLDAAIGKPMQVFRTSLLPLSPRWHLYNIVGGAIMLGSTASPRAIFQILDAYQLAKNEGEALGRIESATGKAAMPPGGLTRAQTEWFQNARKNPTAVAHSFAAGSTLGRMFKTVIEKSYDANQFVDNMYRSMAYLDTEKSALARGMTRAEAIDAGIEAARVSLQSWDRLTPVERAGMRVIFPFYSWTSHLFRFVTQYPHDHPVRLAIAARVAETELSDAATGLPQKFQSMFTPFGIDAEGNTTAIIADGINPFKDVTNWAMLAGFLTGQKEGNIATVTASLNPLISTTLEVAGFDTFRGTPDLYPDLTYDPATGQMTSLANGNLPIAFLNNLIPQTELLTNYAGLNEEFKDLARRDPDAATRQLYANLGLPSSLVRDLNINEEAIKAEVQRYEQFNRTRSEALTTGNLGLMDQYPVLSGYRAQIEALSASGQLAPYQSQQSPEYASAANAAQVAALGNQGSGTDLLGLLAPG